MNSFEDYEMEAEIVDYSIYARAAKNVKNVFNKPEFAELNREKVQDILYVLVYKGNSPRFGCIFGLNENGDLQCPFSAPFGYIEMLKGEQCVGNFEGCLGAIEALLHTKGYKKVTIVMPPALYDSNVINTWYSVMINRGWKGEFVDLSFGLSIRELIEEYETKIAYDARRNLRIASKSGLSIKECETLDDKKEAYRIIKVNRESKGYPLRMMVAQVLDTIRIVPAKMYIVSDESENLAAALVYAVTCDKAQIVYWGDIPGCQNKKVINFLAFKLLQIYHKMGFTYLDIGPSTEDGIPNYGLCDFKDSIGCQRTAKFRLYKEL